MGLTWDVDFIRSVPGMAMAAQVIGSGIGGIVNIFSFGIATGLLGFAFWSTFLISGFLTLAHICNLAQSIEGYFPYFSKVQLGYVAIWSLIFLISSVLSIFGFGFSAILGYFVLGAFLVDGFFKFKRYREAMAGTSASADGGESAANPAGK